MPRRRRDPTVDVHADTDVSDGPLLAGISAPGLAGLTATDYLVDALDLEPIGHLTVEGAPSITPFEDGRPRHPTRLFSRPDADLTILAGELFVPPALGESFAASLTDWMDEAGVDEIAALAGIPIPHGPEEHRTYFIATDDYRARNLTDTGVKPMGAGFLDGLNAALVRRGIDDPRRVCVYVTPVHQQTPDVDAAVRLLETTVSVYDLDVDAEPLRAFAAEVDQYYAGLAERLAAEAETPEDRMYM